MDTLLQFSIHRLPPYFFSPSKDIISVLLKYGANPDVRSGLHTTSAGVLTTREYALLEQGDDGIGELFKDAPKISKSSKFSHLFKKFSKH